MNPQYELVGGILHATPIDETNSLIDSPNFVAAKTLVDKALSATSIADIEYVFKHVEKTLIDYINSPLIDVLSVCRGCEYHLQCIIENSCRKLYFGGIKYLRDKKLINCTAHLISVLQQTITVAPYDEFVSIYEEVEKHLNYPTTLQLIKLTVGSQDVDKFKYIWARLKNDVNMNTDDIIELLRYNINNIILKLVLDDVKNNKLSIIAHNISTGTYHNNEALDILFTEHTKIEPLLHYHMDSVIQHAVYKQNPSPIYYIYKNNYKRVAEVIDMTLSYYGIYTGGSDILDMLEAIIVESNSTYKINYDKLLLNLITKTGFISHEMLRYYISKRHKLTCEPEYYALIALSLHKIELHNQFVVAGIDHNYNNGIYNKIRQIHNQPPRQN